MSEQTTLSDRTKFEIVWAELKRLGIMQVDVTFDGSGDSGEITDVSVADGDFLSHNTTEEWQAAQEVRVELNSALESCEVVLPGEDGTPVVIRLASLITELSDPLTTEQGVDWWNDDGGFGHLSWHAGDDPPRLALEINQRIVTTELTTFEFDRHGEEFE